MLSLGHILYVTATKYQKKICHLDSTFLCKRLTIHTIENERCTNCFLIGTLFMRKLTYNYTVRQLILKKKNQMLYISYLNDEVRI